MEKKRSTLRRAAGYIIKKAAISLAVGVLVGAVRKVAKNVISGGDPKEKA